MFDIGFFELALIGVVLLVVMGPERLPEVARQLAFVIRKARSWVYNIKAEMNLSDDPMMKELKQAKAELNDFGRDMRQLGNDFAQETDKLNDKIDLDAQLAEPKSKQASVSAVNQAKKKVTKKKTTKKTASKKTTSKKVASKKKVAKKATAKKATAKKATTKQATKQTTKKKAVKKVSKKAAKKVVTEKASKKTSKKTRKKIAKKGTEA